MKHQHFAFARWTALIVPVCAALSGCMTSTPIWDAHIGEALKSVTQAQIIDPHAAEHAQAAQGVDGKAAASAMNTYDKSFQQPVPTPNAFVIGVGSGGGSQ
ncbi:hypothetical protein ACTJLC_18460 [Paraburkholderia sp. 22099]|jgi:hypothetical protein|uniref:Lipoprotein n=1 Tax=Paraburkholderia terricola TaxID=169427 RepID=A0A1M6NVD7_9BURK|nr:MULTISPECIES: hypothetical protein [Paraburkholderia]MDR6445207.1 hypothetical protein [Paraburkholderia terricola]SDO19587.1 hypothetical protein SAMN05192547_101158 [Paraburkholderia sediminicola]SHJ99564.1 hypothetical protein SAMN05192548_101158 [Paraburkholderia terricola]